MRTLKWARVLTRAFATAMVASLVLVSIVVPTVSAATPQLVIDGAQLQDGSSQITVRLTGIESPGLIGFNMQLYVDPDYVNIVSASAGNLPSGTYGTFSINRDVAGSGGLDSIGAVWDKTDTTTGLTGDYILFTAILQPLAVCADVPFVFSSTLYANPPVFTGPGESEITPITSNTYSVLSPTTVWVDDDWEDQDDVDEYNPNLVWEYNAWSVIQDGIDAVSGSTVNVLPGLYNSFNITADDVQVIGRPTASNPVIVDGEPQACGHGMYCQAYVNYADNVLIEKLEFVKPYEIGAAETLNGDNATAVFCFDSERVQLKDLVIDGDGEMDGIVICGGEVTISDCTIDWCPTGIRSDDCGAGSHSLNSVSPAVVSISKTAISRYVLGEQGADASGMGMDVGIDLVNTTVTIDHATVKYYDIGIRVKNSDATISNTNISECMFGVFSAGGVGPVGNSNGPEASTRIFGGSIKGITEEIISSDEYPSIGVLAVSSFISISGTDISHHRGWNDSGNSAALSEAGLGEEFDASSSGHFFGVGVRAGRYSKIEMSDCCDIHNNDVGVFAWGLYDETEAGEVGTQHHYRPWSIAQANRSNIRGNDVWGVFNYWGWLDSEPLSVPPATATPYIPPFSWLDFTENFWGDSSGPKAPDHNGKGNEITNYVDYANWLSSSCDGKEAGPAAKFTASSVRAKAGASIQFTDISTPTPGCEVVEWSWSFGDGATSTAQNPSHTYQRPGTYSVKLTIVDSCGKSASYSMSVTIASSTKASEPAKLGVSYLNIDPVQVLPNQEVVVSANICNSGGERGSKTVSLLLNGEAIDSQSVSVSAGGCQQVIFKTSRAVPGTYQVAVDGMAGQFSVLAPRTVTRNVPSQQQTGLGTAGIVAIIAIIVVLIVALVLVFRRD